MINRVEYLDLIGLELSDAKDKLRGKKFRLVYYTSDKQKIFDKELVIRVTENSSEIVLTIGGFLTCPLNQKK
ncbi:MAG TPA: hypothetical protein PK675_02550 [Clostridia bacterium]|nr:hypothetical protein [Clostridia bacterium]